MKRLQPYVNNLLEDLKIINLTFGDYVRIKGKLTRLNDVLNGTKTKFSIGSIFKDGMRYVGQE